MNSFVASGNDKVNCFRDAIRIYIRLDNEKITPKYYDVDDLNVLILDEKREITNPDHPFYGVVKYEGVIKSERFKTRLVDMICFDSDDLSDNVEFSIVINYIESTIGVSKETLNSTHSFDGLCCNATKTGMRK